jgi:integrase
MGQKWLHGGYMAATWGRGLMMARPRKNAPIDLGEAHDLTAGLIERLICPDGAQQVFMRDTKAPGLRVRATPANAKNPQGVKAYVFEAKLNRQTIRRTIGDVRAWTIDAARNEANRLRVTLDEGDDPREIERQQHAAKAAEQASQIERETYTLEKLLGAYCDYLKSLERKSHAAARSIFRVHVLEAWPKVAALPANMVTGEQIADMMRMVIEQGKGRTANKLRSYMRAAYQVAKAARSKASIPLAFKAYNVKSNPASDTEPDESANKADKNPLSADELRTYWQAIKPMPGFIGSVLRLHLLTGGQRIEQLVSLLVSNVAPGSITLMDGKGRPGKAPRPHTVPLTPLAAAALQGCNPVGTYAISIDSGKTHLSAKTFSTWAGAAGVGIKGFKAKRIRSGVETILAAARISSDHRGRLQSHGIAGVQNRHYDGHHYLDEKRHALDVLLNQLESSPATGDNVRMLKDAPGELRVVA